MAVLLGWKLTTPTYATAVGDQLAARLADGTRVQLNTNSALNVRFDGGVRRVELVRGQAFFDVAHDPARPFVVVAGDTEVRAIGTRFDVRRDRGAVQVVLAEGKVAVSEQGSRPASWTLKPGQVVTTGGKPDAARPTTTDVAVATSWTTGQLTFRGTPLAEAVNEVNRYSRAKIVLGAGAPAKARINGIFAIGKPDEFITAMTSLYGLHTERRLDGATELRGPDV
jgi:transmembrane sensor